MDHVHEPHAHGHGHAHDHGAGDYYLEQLLTLFMCGAFGLVAVLMSRSGMLKIILAPEFHSWVLAGGVVLLAFTVIRAVALWAATGKMTHEHHHEHWPDCDHGHDDHHHDHAHHHHAHGHSHDDGHAHGNIFWRLVVLAFPLMLFFLGLPNEGFSKEWIDRKLGKDQQVEAADVAAKGGDVIPFEFHDLNALTLDADKRAAFEGRTVRVKGQLRKVTDTQFTLFKLKMNCCAADTIPLKAVIKTSFATTFNDHQWVSAEGVLQFVESQDKRQFIPVIKVKDGQGLTPATPE
jgi:uncharacterized repeat protein (TIGR03943 family)